jgi:LuxR family maltose regulon positive regulatory protein
MTDSTSASPLLQTKLYLPRTRPGLVSRARLIERLNQAIERKLTVVCAPAGFGKTTLLGQWLASERAAAWLSLDQSDNEPTVFWAYLIAALQTVHAGIGQPTLSLLRSPQPLPLETLLGPLLNEVASLTQRSVLVLDDYHLIAAQPIHQAIGFLLDHLPPQLHLVIASRADPSLPLSRLRARGQLAELRAADLRFTVDEAVTFLNDVTGLDLADQEVAALEARTEGWIAGLQLAALSMRGRDDVAGFISAFAGDDRYIVDYLVEEVLQRQSGAVRSFLLQTSILERLTGSLCDAVTKQQNGDAMLEALERGNLFVVLLDDKRRWYRYHHLFADVLQARLRQELPELVLVVNERASAWHERHGQLDDAIRHALAAPNVERAAGLIELVARRMVRSHQSGRLREWIKALPDDVVRVRPVLCTYYAFAILGVREMTLADARLNDAERWLDVGVVDATAERGLPAGMLVADQAELRSLPGTIALARSFRAQAVGDVAGAADQARRALNLLPEDDHVWRAGAGLLLALAHWASGDLEAAQRIHDEGVARLELAGDITLAISAAFDQAELRKARGRLSEARRLYERSLQLGLDRTATLPGVADLHLGFCDLLCEQNDIEAATQHLRQGEELGKHAPLRQTPYRLARARARLRQVHGDLDGALDLLDEAERLYVRGVVPEVRPVAALRARWWVAQGRLAEARDWVQQQGLSVDDHLEYMREFEHLTLARVLVAGSDRSSVLQVSRFLERLLQAAEQGGRTGSVIEVLVLQVLVEQMRGDIRAGRALLQRAVTLAETEGYVRIFVDAGPSMHALLRHGVRTGGAASYAQRLLSAFDTRVRAESASAGPVVTGLAEPLTARELEILRLVAEGLRNQEIADRLVISLATVKRHIANTYGKLGVDHRTEAAARLTS